MSSAAHSSDHRQGASRGFTLLEVLVSVAVLTTMIAIAWGSFSVTARSKQAGERIIDRYQQVRLAMERLAREISMAYLSKNDQVDPTHPRTLFVGEQGRPVDDLVLSTVSHTRLREDSKEGDQTVLHYYALPRQDDRSRYDLVRRESRRLGGREKPGAEGPADVMLEDVRALHFEYFDSLAKEWRDTWNTRSADGQPDRLPDKVRIALTVRGDDDDEDLVFRTATRLHMRDPLWFSSASE